ncbi:general substrate transporter [Parathielavia appendiculata]|uniref:General substrate transporter n=1 Tax=Parathielavia appendiculata TaxID=2587402 RepID=A0AAN6TTK1_9PEZI|nr:general substrate transporter [Parathielavia appendiculata]
MPANGRVWRIAALAVIGGALFGFDITSMSAIISTQPYLCQFNQRGFGEDGLCLGPSSTLQGLIVAIMPLGSLFGALLSGWLSDRFGRKKSVMGGSLIWIVGSILVCAAVNSAMLMVGRFVNGLSVGICSAQVPVYITEVSPPTMRGTLVSLQQWAITWGILIMYFICYGCSFIQGTASFRVPWGLQMLPAACLFGGLWREPESPRWLFKKDRQDEAKHVLAMLHGHGNPSAPFVQREFQEIQKAVEEERQYANVSWLELFAPGMINRTSIGVFTQIWSQLTGMNVMMYYITYVFTMAGLSQPGSNAVLLPSGIQFVINVVMTVPALLWLDRWGRRRTLLAGAALMCLWLTINAILFALYSRTPEPGEFTSASESMAVSGPPAKAIVASTFLFVASFAPTWGPVSWTYPPELYPLRLRGKAVALATSANWAFNFALAYFVPVAFETITWKVYVIFAVFCACMFLHVFFAFPETANKTLEEVEEIFDDTKPGAIKFIGTPAWKTKNNRAVMIRREHADEESGIAVVEVESGITIGTLVDVHPQKSSNESAH